MIIVTGGAGFIGSNIVKGLNQLGINDIIVVDDLTDGSRFTNLVDCEIADYLDKEAFLHQIQSSHAFATSITALFHQGACSDTTEWDGQFMMANNYEYSKLVLHYCLANNIPFMYASSAAVYGKSQIFKESRENEGPLNVYGYSKLLFDRYVQRILPQTSTQIVGLRYFNVYGPREQHKGKMSSVMYHFNRQIQDAGELKLFEGNEHYGPGEQRRDFIFVNDAVDVNLWFFAHPEKSGIYNVGTGKSRTFNDVAHSIISWHNRGEIDYIPFPKKLKKHYQSFTEADISALRAVGYDGSFTSLEEGIKSYLDAINLSDTFNIAGISSQVLESDKQT